ncbi:MAG: glycosyltransferase [Planctomycetes bacterium]|nr:glycosyltransferase [Planctomycetota bacterium]
MKPALLFVTRNFPPLVGGMERLAAEAVRALQATYRVGLVGPRGGDAAVDGLLDFAAVPHGSPLSFLWHASRAARALAARHRPVAVVAGSGLAATPALLGARTCGARTAVFVHGLDLVHPSAGYRLLCLPSVRRASAVIANSANTARLAAAAGVPAARVRVVNPGVALPATRAEPASTREPRLLFVGRLIRRKGLADFVRHVLPTVVGQVPAATLVVVGGDAPDALAGGDDERARLAAAIDATGMQSHVERRGEVSDAELLSLYASSAALVFPVQDLPGDVEGFGMVAVEAAAHGLPTIAFAAGGVPDAVADGVSGALVPPGDWNRYSEACVAALRGGLDGVSVESCRAHAAAFAWPRFGERLRVVVEELD